MTPDELVRCGVVSAAFFSNRTVICTVRDPITRLASGANYFHTHVGAFLSACNRSDPRVSHELWAHCRPQSDFIPFCQRVIPMGDIDTVLAPELKAGYGIALSGQHKNAGRGPYHRPRHDGMSATDHTIWQMGADAMARASRLYACDLKLAALGWPLGRTCK